MLSTVHTIAINGLDASRVLIEINVTPFSQPRDALYVMVGLPDSAVKESKTRVRSAMENSGYNARGAADVAVNFAPADVKKEGSGYDLPLAVGLLHAFGQAKVTPEVLSRYMFLGELGLDGDLRPVRGVLPAAILARKLGYEALIVPEENAREAAVVNQLKVYGASKLRDVVQHLEGTQLLEPTEVDTRAEFYASQTDFPYDFSEVKGQPAVKRAFEVAAAGGHNLLLVGSPGCGKSMMAKRLPSILPPLTLAESLETTQIHSIAGKLERGATLISTRPFRSPHHTISDVALIGGGPHHFRCGTHWRWSQYAAWRNQFSAQWHLVFRRISSLHQECTRNDATTVGRSHHHHIASALQRHLALLLHAGGSHESLSLWLLQRPFARVHLHTSSGATLSQSHQRSIVRPHRFASGGGTRSGERTYQCA